MNLSQSSSLTMDVRSFLQQATLLSNDGVLASYKAMKTETHKRHIHYMRERNPKYATWTDEEIENAFADAVSCFQSKGGKVLENIVENALRTENISFKSQVYLDQNGTIVEREGVYTIPDIVFGDPKIGTHISEYAVMSLKTSSRERSKLDSAWTEKHPPKLFLYATLEADYPTPEKFQESVRRKLICATPRKKDTRQYKLGFEDIKQELQRVGCSVQSCR